jgi:hypothetical protein
MTSEKIWTWRQGKGKIFKVISNANKGTIEVLNENGETVIRRANLSRKQVEMVEKNFKNFVANKINDGTKINAKDHYDPMIT